MSANWYDYKFYFNDPKGKDTLADLIGESEADSFLESLGAPNVLDESRENVEDFELTEKYLSISLQTSTSCELNDELVLAMKPFGCEFAHISVFYDQVGESEEFYLYRGQPVDDDELEDLMAEYGVAPSLQQILDRDDAVTLQAMLNDDFDHSVTVDDEPLLIAALDYGAYECFRTLLENGADLNVQNSEGNGLLFQLFEHNNKTQVPLAMSLIDSGIDLSKLNSEGNSLLWEAWRFSETVASRLIDKGVAYTHGENAYQDAEDLIERFYVSIAHNDTKVFLQDLDRVTSEQYLDVAEIMCRYDRLAVIQALASKGFNIFDEQNIEACMDEVCDNYSISILEYLFKQAADQDEFIEEFGEKIIDYFTATERAKPIIQRIVDNGFEFEHNGPLGDALRAKQFDIAELLVAGGCPLGDHEPDEEGDGSILHYFLNELSAEALQFLVDHGANTQYKNYEGQTIIARQNERGLKPGVKEWLMSLAEQLPPSDRIWSHIESKDLEKFKADWNALEDKSLSNVKRESLLNVAVANGALTIAQYLLDNGAELEAKSEMGNTPLAYAVINNNLDAATWLLEKGANANALVCLPEKKEDEEDEDTEKLMSMMGLDGLNELAELEEQITEPLEITEDDSSCLMFASGKGNFELVKLLVAAGADIQFKDDDDATALFMAVANGHRDIVEFLVEKGADINCYAGETLLHQACLRANIDMAEYLLGHGLNINAKDDDKSTPLHSAITSSLFNGIEIVEWVINAKADVNALASGKISPLILACQLTNDEAINLLLNYNVDINVVDRDGKTAFDYCVESQQENIDLAKLKPTASNVAVKKKIALIRKFILWRVIPLAILYLVIYIFSTNVANVIVGAIVLWMLYRFIKKKFTPEKPNKMGKMFEGFASAMAKAGEAVEQQEKAKRETRAKWEQSSEQPNIDWVEYLVKQDIITNKAQAYQRLNSVPSLNQASIEEKVAAIVPKSKVAFSRGQFATADNFNDFFSELSLVIASYADCTFSNIELSSAAVSVELNLSGSQHRINAKRLSSDLPPAIIGELRKLLKQQLQLDILATDPMQASIELVILPLKVIDRLRAFA